MAVPLARLKPFRGVLGPLLAFVWVKDECTCLFDINSGLCHGVPAGAGLWHLAGDGAAVGGGADLHPGRLLVSL